MSALPNLWVVFHLEATGLSTTDDHVTEIAGKAFVKGPHDLRETGSTFSTLCYTDKEIPREVERLTGIWSVRKKHSVLRGAPPPEQAISCFVQWIGEQRQAAGCAGATLVGHNISNYGIPLLHRQTKELGMDLKAMLEGVGVTGYLDTLTAIRDAHQGGRVDFPYDLGRTKAGSESYQLSSIHFACQGAEPLEANLADADVSTLAEILVSPALRHRLGSPDFQVQPIS